MKTFSTKLTIFVSYSVQLCMTTFQRYDTFLKKIVKKRKCPHLGSQERSVQSIGSLHKRSIGLDSSTKGSCGSKERSEQPEAAERGHGIRSQR